MGKIDLAGIASPSCPIAPKSQKLYLEDRGPRTTETEAKSAMINSAGGCHCGAVRFTVRLATEPVPALDCNCSVCSMTGFLHIIVPHGDFTLEHGAEVLTSYRFGTGAAEHRFCSVCGVKSFYQPRSHPDAWSINAHCLDTPLALAIEKYDGRNWEAARAALD